jgi:type 1 fimbriae regulatory protein FimB
MKNIGRKARFRAPIQPSVETVEFAAETPKPKKKAFKRTELDENMYLQPEETRAFFEAVESRRDRAIFRVLYHYGLRAHEVGVLQISDYKDRDGMLYIRRGKGSVSRDHRLIPEALKALRSYIKFDRGTQPGPLFQSRKNHTARIPRSVQELDLAARRGRLGISRFMIFRLMRQYCKAAGIPPEKAHPHAWKHTCGTSMADRGNDTDAIQDWLGHRDSKSTEIYKHFSRSRRDESVEKNRDWS